MKPLEHGQILKEIFEERINTLEATIEYYAEAKQGARSEKENVKYDILTMETELCVAFLTDRLETLNKVLELTEKIQSGNISVTEKLDCIMEAMEIMSDL